MLVLTSIPISMMIFIFWMAQNTTVDATMTEKVKTLDKIKDAFGGIEAGAEREMKTLRKELEQMIGQGEILLWAKMVKSGLAEMQRNGWMPRKLRWMNENLAGLMDPFLLYNHGILELATKQFDNLEKEMRKAGITMTTSAQHRSRTKLRIYLNKQGSKKVKKEVLKETGSLEKKMWNQLRETQIPKLQSFIQNSTHADNVKIKAVLDRYLRLHLIIQLKNAGIRLIDGIGLFWWAKLCPELTRDGTDCYFGAMEAAIEEITSWLQWMGGNGNGQEGNDDGSQNIRIGPKMAEELGKINLEENGCDEHFNGAIFKKLTGRTNLNGNEDRMEWQTIILLSHVLVIYYGEVNKANHKTLDGASSSASSVNQPKRLVGILANVTPQMRMPDSNGFSDILGAPNGLIGLALDLKIINNFENILMNGLIAEVKDLANWAEFPKYCAIQIREYSKDIGNGVKVAIEKMHQIMPEFNGFEHLDLDIFGQPSLMDENDILVKDSFIASLLRAIDNVKENVQTEGAMEGWEANSTAHIIRELKSILVTLDKNADMLEHFLRRTRNIRQLFTPNIDLMEDDDGKDEDGKEGNGKGKKKKKRNEEEGISSSSSSLQSNFAHSLPPEKHRIQDIYKEEFECSETINILAQLSLEAMELHIGLHPAVRMANEDANSNDQIKSTLRQNAKAHFLSLKNFFRNKMPIYFEEDNFLPRLEEHIQILEFELKRITEEKEERKKKQKRKATDYSSSLVDENNCHEGLAASWQVKLLNLIVQLVKHYNRIMHGQMITNNN